MEHLKGIGHHHLNYLNFSSQHTYEVVAVLQIKNLIC